MPLILDDHLPNISSIQISRHHSQRQAMPHDLRVKNRRKRHLERHPCYFEDSSLELANPLLYDRLIRHFQTPQERAIERRQKGYAETLEADLLRSEARLDEAQDPEVHSSYTRTEDGEIVQFPDPRDEATGDFESLTREEARERWVDIMTVRFLRGDDEDFDYGKVDESEELDDRRAEERDAEEEWFDGESEDFSPRDGEGKREVRGETGVQDY